MLRFAADENFNGHLLRGLRRRLPGLDVLRVQDTQVSGQGDPEVLAWAAAEGRVLLTHDVLSLTAAANERLRAGKPIPGVVEVSLKQGLGRAIEELQLLAEAGRPEDCNDRILYLP
jgi:hypothetical protein